MRLRRKPWARPELDACEFYIKNPTEHIGSWNGLFVKDQPLHVELGCGKGAFISNYALCRQDRNCIAIDIKSEVLGIAKRRIQAEYGRAGRTVDNLLLTAYDIEKIDEIFSKEEKIEKLFIFFCNPQPKRRWHKHRLTHPRQLEKHREFLTRDAQIEFKTDDEELFFRPKSILTDVILK